MYTSVRYFVYTKQKNRQRHVLSTQIHNADVAGAVGVVIIDNVDGSSYERSGLYSLSGSGLVTSIPVIFIYNNEGNELLTTLSSNPDIYVYLGLRKVAEGEQNKIQKL